MTEDVESLKAEVEILREENASLNAYIDENCPPRRGYFQTTIMDAFSGDAEDARVTFVGSTLSSDVPRPPIDIGAGDIRYVTIKADGGGSATAAIDFFSPSFAHTATANYGALYEERNLTWAERARKLACWILRRPFSEPRLVAVMDEKQDGETLSLSPMEQVGIEAGKSYTIEFPAAGSIPLN